MYRWRNSQFHADKNNTELAALMSSQAQISTVKHRVCDEQVRGEGVTGVANKKMQHTLHETSTIPANTRRSSDVVLMLGQRRRRWPNI